MAHQVDRSGSVLALWGIFILTGFFLSVGGNACMTWPVLLIAGIVVLWIATAMGREEPTYYKEKKR